MSERVKGSRKHSYTFMQYFLQTFLNKRFNTALWQRTKKRLLERYKEYYKKDNNLLVQIHWYVLCFYGILANIYPV